MAGGQKKTPLAWVAAGLGSRIDFTRKQMAEILTYCKPKGDVSIRLLERRQLQIDSEIAKHHNTIRELRHEKARLKQQALSAWQGRIRSKGGM